MATTNWSMQDATPINALAHAAAGHEFPKVVAATPMPIVAGLPQMPLPAPISLSTPPPTNKVASAALAHACHVTGAPYAQLRDIAHCVVSSWHPDQVRGVANKAYTAPPGSVDGLSHALAATNGSPASGAGVPPKEAEKGAHVWRDIIRRTAGAALKGAQEGGLVDSAVKAAEGTKYAGVAKMLPTAVHAASELLEEYGLDGLELEEGSETEEKEPEAGPPTEEEPGLCTVEDWLSTIPASSEGCAVVLQRDTPHSPSSYITWARDPVAAALSRNMVTHVRLNTPVAYHLRPEGGHAVQHVCGISGTGIQKDVCTALITMPYYMDGMEVAHRRASGVHCGEWERRANIADVHVYHSAHLQWHARHSTRHPGTGEHLSGPSGSSSLSTHTHLLQHESMEHTHGDGQALRKAKALVAAQSSIVKHKMVSKQITLIPELVCLAGTKDSKHALYNLGITSLAGAVVQAHLTSADKS